MDDRRPLVVIGLISMLFLLVVLAYAVASSEPGLDGTGWEMDTIVVDGSMTPAIDGAPVTITFGDGSVDGSAGCNEYFGSYEDDDGSLRFGDLASTLMFCEGAVGDQEFVYLAHLGEVDRYRIDGDQLTLSSGSTDLVVFTALDS